MIRRAFLVVCLALLTVSLRAQSPASTGWSANIAEVRQVATLIPGRKPLRINVLKFAESHRTKNFSVKGEAATPSVQARTVFQVVYPDGTVMVDAGMDVAMHKQIGRGAEGEPYFPQQAQEVDKALRAARAIIFTHEHGDHVTGVIRTPYLAELAPKTILTWAQVTTLETRPQFPDLKITEEEAQRYHIIDYDRYMAFAPGWTLIKAAGHTPGSQMMFITLESGREYLLIGDTAWHMDSVRKNVGKDAPWITEDTAAVNAQLTWLNGLYNSEKNLVIVASHDDDEHKELIAKKLLGGKLE
jgi:glyoxylase-like metal-dependent hydrolase (beta-lactamase superfamily II)